MNTQTSLPSKGEATRQAILAAAYGLFLEQGFSATSMRQIAQRAGLAVSGIYNHFASKEAIFDVLIVEKHPYQQILPILQTAAGETLEAFFRNAARAIVNELSFRPDFLKLIFIEITEFRGSHFPLVLQIVFPQAAALLEHFGPPDSRLRDIPLPVLLRTFIGLVFSYYIVQYITDSTQIQIPGMEGDANVDQFVDIFLNGILKPPEIV